MLSDSLPISFGYRFAFGYLSVYWLVPPITEGYPIAGGYWIAY
jgi:hypothetical protein